MDKGMEQNERGGGGEEVVTHISWSWMVLFSSSDPGVSSRLGNVCHVDPAVKTGAADLLGGDLETKAKGRCWLSHSSALLIHMLSFIALDLIITTLSSVCLSFSLSLSQSVSVCLSPSVCLSLALSLSLTLFLSHTLSLSLLLSLSLPPFSMSLSQI